MKKKYSPIANLFVLPVFCFLLCTSTLCAQNFQWVRGAFPANTGTASYANYPNGICVDEQGNSYVTGRFSDTLRFDSTFLNTHHFTTYLASYNTSGNLRWAIKAGENQGNMQTSGISYDHTGNIRIIGTFQDSIVFNTLTIYSHPGKQNGFLAEYDTLGNFLSAESIQSSGNMNSGPSVSCISGSKILITGTFKDTLEIGSMTLTSADSNNFYLAELNSAGNVVFVKKVASNICNHAKVTYDQNKNIFLSGMFKDSLSINSSIVANAKSGAFIMKFDSSGTFNWATSLLGLGAYVTQIKTDAYGNIYAAGIFNDSLSLSNVNFYFPGIQHNVFLAKYDASGTCLWAKRITDFSITQIRTYGLSVGDNYVYVSGEFTDSIIFNGIQYHSTTPILLARDIFIAKYDLAGNEVSFKQAGSFHEDYCFDMDIDATGYLYLTGSSYFPAFFDSIQVSDSSANHFPTQSSYVAKLFVDVISLNVSDITAPDNLVIFPNPADDKLLIKTTAQSIEEAEILNPLGQKEMFMKNINPVNPIIDTKNLKRGIYILKIKFHNKILCKKFVVQREKG